MADDYKLIFGFIINKKDKSEYRVLICSTDEIGAWEAAYLIAERMGLSHVDVDKYAGIPDDEWLNQKPMRIV